MLTYRNCAVYVVITVDRFEWKSTLDVWTVSFEVYRESIWHFYTQKQSTSAKCMHISIATAATRRKLQNRVHHSIIIRVYEKSADSGRLLFYIHLLYGSLPIVILPLYRSICLLIVVAVFLLLLRSLISFEVYVWMCHVFCVWMGYMKEYEFVCLLRTGWMVSSLL